MKLRRRIFGTITIIVGIMMILALAGCDFLFNDDSKTPSGDATLRYETVPYSKSSAHSGGDNYNLVYSAHDNTNNYYLFVLGHVNSVPVAYRTAMRYNGQSAVTIAYSKSDVSETSISKSVGETNTHSITNSSNTYWGV